MMRNRFALLLVCFGVITVATVGHGQDPTAGTINSPAFVEPPSTELYFPALGETEVLSITAFAFEAWSQTENLALEASGAQRFCDGSVCYLEAPVELPEGSIISQIELDAIDQDGLYDVSATVSRCPVGASSCTGLASISTTGTPGATQVVGDLQVPEIVDNQANSYLVEVVLGDSVDTTFSSVRLVFQPPVSPPPTRTMSINSYAFEPYNISARGALSATGVLRYCDGLPCLIEAPVELPSETVVTRLELDGYDVASENVVAELFRCPFALSDCQSVGSVATSGTPGTTQVGIDLPSPESIDNQNYSYIVEVTLSDSSDTGINSVRLTINDPPTPVREDRLSISAFAYEPWSQTDRNVLDASGAMRFCNGSVCAPIGPVELPSGAWVTSIELSARDVSADNVTAAFSRCAVGGFSCEIVGGVTTSGTPGLTQVTADLPAPEYIDNRNYTYAIQVILGPDQDTGFLSTRLVVDMETVFGDGFDSGDTSAWSAAVP